MGKSGNVMQLSALIQQKAEADRQQIEQQTSEQFRLHAESLKKLSAEGLSSTARDIEKASKVVRSMLNEQARQIKQQSQSTSQEVTVALEAAIRRLRWVLLWPLLVTAALCLVICGLTWVYWKAATPWEIVTMSNGKQYKVMKDDWTTCNTPVPKPCRLED